MSGKQPTCHPLADKKEWYLHHSPDDSGYENESKHLRVNNLNVSTKLKGGENYLIGWHSALLEQSPYSPFGRGDLQKESRHPQYPYFLDPTT